MDHGLTRAYRSLQARGPRPPVWTTELTATAEISLLHCLSLSTPDASHPETRLRLSLALPLPLSGILYHYNVRQIVMNLECVDSNHEMDVVSTRESPLCIHII